MSGVPGVEELIAAETELRVKAEKGLDVLRRELAKCLYILGFVEGTLQDAIDWAKLYENPTLQLMCARDLELIEQLQVSGRGHIDAKLIATAGKKETPE